MAQEYRFNVRGKERKKLVGAISEILDQPTEYLGAPEFQYRVGDYTIDKEGTVTGDFNLTLFAALEQRGYEPEPSKTFHLITPRGTLLCQERFDTAAEAEAEGYSNYFHYEGRDVYIKTAPNGATEHSKWFAVVGTPFDQPEPVEEPEPLAVPDRLTIEMPLDGFTPESIDNLCKMVTAKENLLMAALGADTLPIQMLEDRIAFPWFGYTEDAERVNAYSQLIAALCATAKEKKRVTAKAQDGFENEKFAMRVWLIGLGCVGAEYKALRRIMGENLGGNSAWRYGKPEVTEPVEADTAPESAEQEMPEEVPAEETEPAQAEDAEVGGDE